MIDRTVRRRAGWCSLAVATSLLVAGCSGSAGDASSAPPTTASSAPSSAATSASAGGSATPTTSDSPTAGADPSATGSPTSDPSSSGTPVQALASREFTVNGTYVKSRLRMRFDVVELKRRGDLLDLTASLTNLEQDRDRDLRWQVGTRFDGAYRKDISAGANFSGVVLTDLAGKKRYLVAADSGNACVCTVELGSVFVDAGQSVELSATYAAPPASTTKLDVTVSSLGTFRDLPIS
ncbi:hypothetical protein [uncultured Friedmanniella sp.]|uniref:hypothetical protein n=1 Tax=uncultured Friedmanniella sp. TaxID=335381 RepID=UPI0035CAC6CE